MDINFEQKVREKAYEIWMAAGMEDGAAHDHWVAAEQVVLKQPESAKKAKTPAKNAEKVAAPKATAKTAAKKSVAKAKSAKAPVKANAKGSSAKH